MLTVEEKARLDEVLETHDIIPYSGDKPEDMIKWAEALESGEFEQCSGKLNKGANRRCCLGVLCDISGAGGWHFNSSRSVTFVTSEGESSNYLPHDLALRYFNDASKFHPHILKKKDDQLSFPVGYATCNDEMGLNFNQIAWLIRESVKYAD